MGRKQGYIQQKIRGNKKTGGRYNFCGITILDEYNSLTVSQKAAFTDSQCKFILKKTNHCPLNALVIIITQAFNFRGTANQIYVAPTGDAGMLFDAFGQYDIFAGVWVSNFGLRDTDDNPVFGNGRGMLQPLHLLENNHRVKIKKQRLLRGFQFQASINWSICHRWTLLCC